MMLKRLLRRDTRGIGAVEFALVAPVLISFVVGISQMGKLFFANADMKNAMAHGARVASVWPVPDDAAILAAVNDRLVRADADDDAEAALVHGTDANGNAYVEINMTYSVPLDFIFFSAPPVTLSDSRRVFTQVTNANSTSYTGSTSSGGTTGSTTTGGTSTSASSTGGTTSASSTSASSTGGTTSSTSASSTSASSTSSTSTTSSTTSASSSGDNGSSGNASSSGNNGSSGHAHGDCNKNC